MKRIEILNRIQEIYAKLEKNSLVANELEELVNLSNSLYERALILRYKAAEQRVFSHDLILTTNEIADNADELSEAPVISIEATPTIDFSIFQSEVDTIIMKEPSLAMDLELMKNPSSEEQIESKLDFQETEVELVKKEDTQLLIDEKDLSMPEIEVITLEKIDWTIYFDKILSEHDSGIQKSIDTLNGSFGLNERILFINELFNGEAEKFSNAIIQLDKLGDWFGSKKLLNDIANQENWDSENEIICDFILHVKRKHA